MYTSIKHFTNIETHGEYLVSRNTVGGVRWVQVYRGTPEKCEIVVYLRQGKKMLSHQGKRFGSVESAIAHFARTAV